jgi:membrane protease YdiL (CAAX protease family)
MTVRIAVIGDLGPTSPATQEVARTAQLLAPEVELVRLDRSTPDADWEATLPATGATAYDGLWFVTPPEGQAPSKHEAAAYAIGHRLVAQGMPVLTVSQSAIEPGTYSGPVPEPQLHGFLGGARWHAQTRAKREVAAARATEEARPRTYVHQLRATAHRWWRPVLTLFVFSTAWLLIAAAVSIPFAVLGQLPEEEDFALSTGTNLWMNLILAAFIPAGMIATRVGGWRPWGRLFSVTGRLRWGWLLRCMALITPLWLGYLTVNWFVYDQEVMARPKDWIGLLVVALLTTPLQAAGEEVAFRGVLVQAVGAWFAKPMVALVVTTALSFAGFCWAHGSMDIWIWVDIGALAIAGCWLTWRTGGLEAAFALHIVNNLVVSLAGIILGGLEESYVDSTTTGSPVSAGMSIVVMTMASAIILRAAKRKGIAPNGWTAAAQG